MRAITVLICLALGRDIAASIFRHSYRPPTSNLDVQPLDYVDQQQQQQQRQQQLYQQQQQEQQHDGQRKQQQEQQQKRQEAKIYRHHDKSSSESEESKERHFQDRRQNAEYQRQVGEDWNSPFTTLIRGEQMPLGDVIAWQQISTEPRMSNTYKQESSEETYKKQQWDHTNNNKQTDSRNSDEEDIEKIFNDAYRITQHVSDEDKKKLHDAFVATENKDKQHEKNATEMLKKHKYGVEEHVVKTDDGYFLTMFRVKPQEASLEDKKRPIVLLVHGLLGSADDWLLMGPGKSLAYKMADEGFDVWLGNTRGSKYSRRHASKHPAQSDFWKFSIDEIALHDLPKMIDHALEANQESKLYYVGHSQATTAFFALASTRPEYREKIAVMYALSPMAYMTHVRSPLLRMISPKSRYYEAVHRELGHGEFKPSKDLIKNVGGDMCESQIGCHHVCSNVNFVMAGVDTAKMKTELIPVIAAHLPAGASTRQIKQYGQAKAAGEFRKYDYGPTINEKVYGKSEPPKYNMTEVKVPVVLYHSEEDWMAHPKDVEKLNKELPDVREKYQVPEEHFSHMDFQFSEKAPKVVNDRLIKSIKKDYNPY